MMNFLKSGLNVIKRSYISIQFLRGVAALAVLFYHLYSVNDRYFAHLQMPDFFQIGKAGVDLFFVVSGFIIYVVSSRDFGFADAKPFLLKRVCRVYPVYWFYTALILLASLFLPGGINRSQGGEFDILRSLLLLPQEKLPVLMVGWTLVYEMYFYLIFAVIIVFFVPHQRIMVVAILGLLTSLGAVWNYDSPTLAVILNPLVLEFFAGCFCAYLLVGRGTRLPFPRSSAIVSSLSFVFLLMTLPKFVDVGMMSNWQRLLYFGLPAAICLFALVNAELCGMKFFGKWLGDCSYTLYLSHILVLNSVAVVFTKLFPSSFYLDLMLLALVFVLVVVYAYVAYVLVERPLNKFVLKLAQVKN